MAPRSGTSASPTCNTATSTSIAVGHGIATHAEIDAEGTCRTVRTCWIPGAEVERVAPAKIPNVELRMEALAELADGAGRSDRLSGRSSRQYRDWIADQKKVLPSLTPKRREMAEALLQRAGTAAKRIEDGIKVLSTTRTRWSPSAWPTA